jgi:aminoglycoside/choline kinase family phosphotransferase
MQNFELRPASSDASFRRYFRLTSGDACHIVMDAPPIHEETGGFCRIARQLRGFGLNVPEIVAENPAQGFVLMSDLGSRHYLDELTDDNVGRLYGDALEALLKLQSGGPRDDGYLPAYDRQLLTAEMDLFRDWYLARHLEHVVTDEQQTMMGAAWNTLVSSAHDQPQVWVHRDYHSRNLMVTTRNNPGILDFQDAVIGPLTYDLVSLLKDCYIEWPAQRVQQWALDYQRMACRSGLLDNADETTFLRWFRRMGIQRHLKVAGIFARLYYRDGKAGYLADIPLTMKYLLDALREDDGLQDLYRFVSSLEQPRCMP